MAEQSNSPGILLILINFYNDNEVIQFIRNELAPQVSVDFHVLVVNNGSNDSNALAEKVSSFPFAGFLDAGENRGYLGAAWFGLIKRDQLGLEWPEFVILSNTDIILEKSDFLSGLIACLNKQDFAIAGPALISGRSGNYNQNPFLKKRISRTRLKFLRVVFSFYFFYCIYQFMSLVKSFLRSGISQRHDEAGLENVYAVHGAFLIFNGPFLRSVKMEMNEVPFLFGEEIFMAELALKQNQKVIYDGRLKVIHMEHSTTGLFKSPNLVLHLRSSVDLLLRKFF